MEYLFFILLYLFIINIITTIRLIKSEGHEVFQKVIQSLLIWLLPFFGAFLVSHFLNDNPIIMKSNWIKYFIVKIVSFPFLIKIVRVQKEYYNDISSSNYMTTADISACSGGSCGSMGD